MTDYVCPSPYSLSLEKNSEKERTRKRKNSISFDLHQGCFSNLTKLEKSDISLKSPLSSTLLSIEMGRNSQIAWRL